MKIANIVTDTKLTLTNQFNVVNSMDEIIHGIPTLIIGFKLVNHLYPNFDILNIEVEKNIYWTFKKNEKRDKYNDDLNWFIEKVYNDLTKNCNYIFVDLIQLKNVSLIKIFKKIKSINKIISYIDNDMVYISGENLIFGVDLNLVEYVGLDRNKIINKIKNISNVFLCNNEIIIEYKRYYDELGLPIKYIPYLYSINNEETNITSSIHIPREG